MSMTLSSMRTAVRMVSRSLAWSMPPASSRWLSMRTEPRLQTAVSSAEVFSVISVQRLELWMTPTWSCGLRTLQGSLKVIQGWPVSKMDLSIFFQRSTASISGRRSCRGGDGLVFAVAFFKGAAVEVVEVGDFVGAEEGPVFTGLHALHEEIGNPVGGVEVVGAAALVAGVDAELEEVLDVVVPDFEVGAAGAAALAALIDGDELVVVQLEEGNDALAFAIGAFDVAAGAAHAVQEPPRPPAHLERKAFSAMPRIMMDSMLSSTL
jgi:hypothetical protein